MQVRSMLIAPYASFITPSRTDTAPPTITISPWATTPAALAAAAQVATDIASLAVTVVSPGSTDSPAAPSEPDQDRDVNAGKGRLIDILA